MKYRTRSIAASVCLANAACLIRIRSFSVGDLSLVRDVSGFFSFSGAAFSCLSRSISVLISLAAVMSTRVAVFSNVLTTALRTTARIREVVDLLADDVIDEHGWRQVDGVRPLPCRFGEFALRRRRELPAAARVSLLGAGRLRRRGRGTRFGHVHLPVQPVAQGGGMTTERDEAQKKRSEPEPMLELAEEAASSPSGWRWSSPTSSRARSPPAPCRRFRSDYISLPRTLWPSRGICAGARLLRRQSTGA